MPNRILRDWTDSDKINSLTVHAERFFVRLIMRVDDFGCFYADTRLLKANLFPLLLDTIREADLLRWIAECEKAGLIVLYENANKKYVQIIDFRQRLDKAKSKYPLPSDIDFREIVTDFPAETETETETETKQKPNTKPKGSAGDSENFSPKNEKENTGLPGAEISMPFGDGFKLIWDQWKIYKSKEFSFKYRSIQSEQASIDELVNLANGSELMAIEIIRQSIAKTWKGLFELKVNKHGSSKSISQQKSDAAGSFTERARIEVAAIARKTGDRPEI